MHTPAAAIGPFAMLLDPEAVLAAMHNSERLNRLESRICRPLDRVTVPAGAAPTDDAALRTEAEIARIEGALIR